MGVDARPVVPGPVAQVPVRSRSGDHQRTDRLLVAEHEPVQPHRHPRVPGISHANRAPARSRTSSTCNFPVSAWSSGDPYANNTTAAGAAGALSPGPTGLQGEYANANNQVADISTFRFHPDYHVDLIFFRNILQQIEGAYYFRPSVDYDFLRHADGEKLGAGGAVIWSRASQFVQTPGHKRAHGIEVDLQLSYQSKDGSRSNNDPSKLGGFFAMLQYGIFFPLGGLEYLPGETSMIPDASLSAAQVMRLVLGVIF